MFFKVAYVLGLAVVRDVERRSRQVGYNVSVGIDDGDVFKDEADILMHGVARLGGLVLRAGYCLLLAERGDGDGKKSDGCETE